MDFQKNYQRSQGQLSQSNPLPGQFIFQASELELDTLDSQEYHDAQPRGNPIELDLLPYLQYLPAVEAEVVYLYDILGKKQVHIGRLLGMSQASVSYRLLRARAKISYLMPLTVLDVRKEIEKLEFLDSYDRGILYSLFFTQSFMLTAQRHGSTWSHIRYVFAGSLRKLRHLSSIDPDKWFHSLGLLLYLKRFCGLRVADGTEQYQEIPLTRE